MEMRDCSLLECLPLYRPLPVRHLKWVNYEEVMIWVYNFKLARRPDPRTVHYRSFADKLIDVFDRRTC